MKKKSDQRVGKWQGYVDVFSEAIRNGKNISREDNGFFDEGEELDIKNDTLPKSIVVCSPHPDDECLTGALPLRLSLENNVHVVNLAVTLGSDSARRQQRRNELEEACALLGFQNRVAAGENGFENVRVEARKDLPGVWRKNVLSLVACFFEIRPVCVVMPHRNDGHPTHEGTHMLVSDALSLYTQEAQIDVVAVENEFWHPNRKPNLLVGIGNKDLALLVAALTRHKGEICRNPYHLFLPARMMDNLRRGWELVRGRLENTPDFCFAELYKVSVSSKGEKKKWGAGKKVYSPDQRIDFF